MTRYLLLAALLVSAAACEESGGPSGPSTAFVRANLSIQLEDVATVRSDGGIQYVASIRIREIAGGSATVTNITLEFRCGLNSVTFPASASTLFPDPVLPGSSQLSTPVSIPAGEVLCQQVQAMVQYFDSIGIVTSSGAAVLPEPPPA